MREYDAKGKLANAQNLLSEYGFHVGSHVIRKDKVHGEIVGFDGTSSVLLDLGNKRVKVDASSFLGGQWMKFTPKATEVFMDNWSKHNCLQFLDGKVAYLKSRILIQLRNEMSASTCVCKPESLRLRCKPKGVVAAEKIPKHSLKLFPFTLRIDTKAYTSNPVDPTSPNVWICSAMGLEFYAASVTTLPREGSIGNGSIVPFWFVQVTHAQDQANCEMVFPKRSSTKSDEEVEIKIPHLRNKAPIAKDEELLIFKPKPVRAMPDLDELVSVPKKRLRGKESL
eukprot:Skav225413  [mRNA]  locus=scaffold2656:746938:747783:- [translate_table: standard]